MSSTLDSRIQTRLFFVSRLFAYAVAAFVLLVLAARLTDGPVQSRIGAAMALPTPLTAVGLVLGATAVIGIAEGDRMRLGGLWLSHLAATILIMIMVLAPVYLAEATNAGLPTGSAADPPPSSSALTLILLGFAVLCIDYRDGWLSSALTALALVMIELDLVGDAFGVSTLNQTLPLRAMTLSSALAQLLLFVALLLARPQQGWYQYAFHHDRVGIAFRLLLPAVVIVPIVLTDAVRLASEAGLLHPRFGFTILAVATTVVLSALLSGVATWLTRAGAALRTAEGSQRDNAQLLEVAMQIAQLGAWTSNLRTPAGAADQVEWSAELYRIFGLSHEMFDGRLDTLLSFAHPDDRGSAVEAYRTAASRETPTRVAYRILRTDGAIRWVQQHSCVLHDEAGVANRMVGIIQDVTESRLVEQQLVQAQKMEAVGNLTGGMAHDFNNLLGVIIGNLELLPPELMSDKEVADLIADALDAATRGADLNRRLLAFARRQPLRPRLVDPNELVAGIVKLLGRTLGEAIEIALNLAPEVAPIVVDPVQLEASIANLANNARDAMPRGGRLIFATANRHLDADYAASHTEVEAGDYVMIEVSDTGSGMPPEVLARVFEPFFTTKEQGRGTGLGLSMVFGFMKQSGGHINVYSEVGVGTAFRLYLPFAAEGAELTRQPTTQHRSVGGHETVLVVEDNTAMRRVVVRQLSELGYRVLEADSGSGARALLTRMDVDVLLTDVVMPGGIDGFELARLAMTDHPRLKSVLTSGFSEHRLNGYSKRVEGVRLLSRPYRRDDLARTLREVLDAP